MNIYDFDGTIYYGDSTADFYFYCLKKHPSILKTVIPMLWAFFLYILGIKTKTQFKEKMYRFLTCVNDIDKTINDFWDTHGQNIMPYYKANHKDDDIIISASPEFLLKPICSRLGIKTLIASRVDKRTGKYDGENCHGEEKVKRLNEAVPDAVCNEFYSDSFSDAPLAGLARKAFIVRKNTLTPWDEYVPTFAEKFKKTFLSTEFLMFLIIGVINTFAGSLFAILYRSFIPDNAITFLPDSISRILNDLIAFVPGYITANVLSYFLNSICTFHDYKFGVVKYLKFLLSSLPNLIIQTVMVAIFSGVFRWPSLIVYLMAAIIGVPITFVCVKLFAFGKKK